MRSFFDPPSLVARFDSLWRSKKFKLNFYHFDPVNVIHARGMVQIYAL